MNWITTGIKWIMQAGLSKVVFIGLVLAHGSRYLNYQAGLAVGVDSLFVPLFAAYLVAGARVRPTG